MKKTLSLLLVSLVLTAQAQITSTFDTDADGWKFYNASNVSNTVNFTGTNGNPGGYISTTYASNQNSSYQVWIAPAKFLGSHLAKSLGMKLKFDLQQSQASTATNTYTVVKIKNASTYIYFTLQPPAVSPSWTSYSVTLDETDEWYYSTGSTLASRAQIKSILTNITAIEIRGTYASNASYASGLDNFVLEERTLATAPAITSFSQTSGEPGTTITINGSDFDPTPGNNIVYFESVTAAINSASTTQLSVVIPVGTTYGAVTIINKTTGLVTRSTKPFNPIFAKGGRIIPASFASKIDILLDPTAGNDINGLSCFDMDGDGWNDIIVAEQALNDISIFRNLAQGGSISASSFAPKVSFDGGGNSGGIQMVDLDGDGKLDITASYGNGSNNYFVTFRNISTPGNIAFEAAELWYGLAYSGFTSRVIDVDGDGRADLIGQHGSSSVFTDLWIAQNISTPGNIEFGTSVDFTFGNSIDAGAGVGASDLDNDGKPELLVSDNFGARFHILKNNSTPGTISFSQAGAINTGQYNSSLQAADFNLDGKNDLIWKKSGGAIYIRLNTNAGGALDLTDFTTEVILTGDVGAYGGMSISDINGDGKPDIVASDDADVGVYENIYSGGAFDANAFVPAYQFPGGGASATTGFASDLNGDSKPDLIFGATKTSISIFENNNIHAPVISVNTVSPLKGNIGSTVTITGNNFSTIPGDNHVYFGAVKATVLTASATQITVSVPAGATYAPVSVRKGEFTSRYRLPFITTFSPGITFDNTHFAPPVNFTLTSANYGIDVGDLNRDSKPDIIAQGNGSFIFRNTHISGAISTSSLLPDDTLSNSILNPRLEDFDGDGLLDAAAGQGQVQKNNSTSIEINFLPVTSLGGGGSNLDFSDFNADGKMDIAITVDGNGTDDLKILENRTANLTGNFVTGTYASFSQNFLFTKPAPFGGVVTEDFDGDGFPDIVTTNPTLDNVSIYRNLGLLKISAAQFAARIDVAVGDNPGRIYKGDFDADGKVDLMFYHGTGTTTSLLIVLQNTSTTGDISFSRIDLTNPSATTVAHIADLDGDGKPEILTTSEAGNRFTIFKNLHTSGALTAASFGTPFNITATAPRAITTADLNLDGKPEIILTRAAGLLVVYENLVPSAPTISISTQPAFTYACEGLSATFSVDATGTTNITYRWQKFNGTVFTDLNEGSEYTGTTTKTLSINTATTGFSGNGQYRCRINGDLATEVFSNSVQFTINSLPSPPIATGGSKCISPSTVTLTATGASDGNYNWYSLPTGGSVLGVNGTFITPSITTTTTYYVSIEDTFCESTRTPVVATIALLSKPTLTSSLPLLNGSINLCNGETFTLNAPNAFALYTWSNGTTTQQTTITTSGNYSLIVQDAGGCTSPPSDAIAVTINPYPTANITANGTELIASLGDSYQWYQNGAAVDGATNQSFEFNILEYGKYLVDVTDNGCTSTSTEFEYLITDVETSNDVLKLYPNPIEKILYVEFHPPYTVTLINTSGSEVAKASSNIRTSSIDFSSLANGTYILQLKNDSQVSYHRLTKK